MKLYDLLKNSSDEITVHDKDYDVEVYFYGVGYSSDSGEIDKWDKAMLNLSKLLEIIEQAGNTVTVNLSEVIEKSIKELSAADMFIRCNIDDIMSDIMNILSGYVSEKWLEKFVDVLERSLKSD